MRQAKDFIIFPLDVPTPDEAKRYIDLLSNHVGMFKVGLELFIHSGPEIIHFIQRAGDTKIFLDLKLHDIPETVFLAMARIREFGVAFTTVHCGENQKMLEAAVSGSQGKVGILGVTVLTSVSGEDILSAGYREEYASDPTDLVLKRAKAAKTAGCNGVVCSGLEASMIKNHVGEDFLTVTPGIRPAWEAMGTNMDADDQKRVTTPAQAIQDGADYLVIGRPIRNADDPRAAASRIAREIEEVIQPS